MVGIGNVIAVRPSKNDKYAGNKRNELLKQIHVDIGLQSIREIIAGNSDAFDAVICVLAASDFLLGKCISVPADKIERVGKEGWIWLKSPDANYIE